MNAICSWSTHESSRAPHEPIPGAHSSKIRMRTHEHAGPLRRLIGSLECRRPQCFDWKSAEPTEIESCFIRFLFPASKRGHLTNLKIPARVHEPPIPSQIPSARLDPSTEIVLDSNTVHTHYQDWAKPSQGPTPSAQLYYDYTGPSEINSPAIHASRVDKPNGTPIDGDTVRSSRCGGGQEEIQHPVSLRRAQGPRLGL